MDEKTLEITSIDEVPEEALIELTDNEGGDEGDE